MKKFLTYSVVMATIAWSMGIAAVLPAAAAYSAVDGDVVKVAAKDRPAVYYISGGKKYLFVNRVTYSTWASAIGDSADKFAGLKAISQADFDAISTGGNITVRPGTSLVKFDDGAAVYAVGAGAKLYQVADSAALSALYSGVTPITIQSGFRANYYDNGNSVATLTATSKYPDGTLIKASTGDTYLLDGGNKRMVTTDAFTANGFKASNVRTVSDLTAYGTGSSVTAKEAASSPVSGTSAPVAGGTVSVSLASDTPAAANIADGTAYNNILKVVVAAGSAETKVTGLTVTRTGLMANSNVTGVSVWDAEGNRHGDVMTSFTSDNKVTIGFGSYPVTVPAGSSKTITVAFNLGTSAGGGTVGATIASASDIATNGTVSGSFPLVGNVMNVVDGASSLAAVSIQAQSVGGNAASGDAANAEIGEVKEIAKIKFSETSGINNITVNKISLYVEGTAKDKDLTNFQLIAPDNTILATASMASDKYVTLNLASPYVVPKSTNRTLTVKATIADGAANYFRIQVQSETDAFVKDAALGYGLIPSDSGVNNGGTYDNSATGWQVETSADGYFKMKSGSVTITKSTASPTGFISAGAQDVVLAKFDVKAVGESVELRKIGLQIATTSEGYAKHLSGNVKIKSGSDVLLTTTAGDTAYTLYNSATTQYTLSQYLTIASGETKTIEVIGSVSSLATSTSDFTAKIGNMYVKRLSTLDYADTLPSVTLVSGNQLTVQATALTLAKDTSLPSKNVAKDSTVEIARFVVKAGSAEGVKVTNASLKLVGNGAFSAPESLQNLELWDGSTQLGSTVSSVATSSNSFSFTLNLAKDQQKTISVKAKILTTATGVASTTIDSYTYIGSDTGNSTSVTDDVSGQVITVGSGAVTFSAVSDTSAVSTILGPSGSSQVQVGKWKALGSTEELTLKKITFTTRDETYADDTTSGNFGTFSLYDGSTLLGDCVYTTGDVVCSALNLVIPADSYKYVTLKASINNTLDVDSINTFVIKSDSNTDMEVQGSSGLLATSAINTSGADSRIATSTYYKFHQGYPTLATASSGSTLNLSTAAEIFRFTITNSGARAINATSVAMTISATGLTNASFATGTLSKFRLYDEGGTELASSSAKGLAGGVHAADGSAASYETDGSIDVTFNQTNDTNSALAEYIINPGETKTFIVKADTSDVLDGKTSGTVTVSASMAGNTVWDGAGAWGSGALIYSYMQFGSTSYGANQAEVKATDATIYGATLSRSI